MIRSNQNGLLVPAKCGLAAGFFCCQITTILVQGGRSNAVERT